jgi:hypothetical protein
MFFPAQNIGTRAEKLYGDGPLMTVKGTREGNRRQDAQIGPGKDQVS